MRSKFNFWWDAESAAVFLRQPWANKFLVPIDVCQLTNFTREIHDRSLPTGKEARRWLEVMFNQEWAVMHLPMWDELTVAIMLDHSIITEEDDLYVDVDYNAGRHSLQICYQTTVSRCDLRLSNCLCRTKLWGDSMVVTGGRGCTGISRSMGGTRC